MSYNPRHRTVGPGSAPASPASDLVVSTPHGVMGIDHFWDRVSQKTRDHQPNSVYLLDVAARRWKQLPNPGPWPENLYETGRPRL